MSKARSSKGFLLTPVSSPNISDARRQKWLDDAHSGFVGSTANKAYYLLILEMLWPRGHGLPGPHVSQSELRAAIDAKRKNEGKKPYVDPFRQMRELQGEEGFKSIIKEGVKYQLTSMQVGSKREPRAKPQPRVWEQVKTHTGHRCSHCGQQEPDIKLQRCH